MTMEERVGNFICDRTGRKLDLLSLVDGIKSQKRRHRRRTPK
jgi:hypothetical protein